ncbi:MAG: pitrilysin family protein [Filomicrobium sp.]
MALIAKPMSWTSYFSHVVTAVLASSLFILPAAAQSAAVGTTSEFRLENGLQVVLIADHRLPVVTHMVWYKAGSIDDPQGASGLAHLLEHLMFKSYDAQSPEPYAETISRLGGVDNARTTHDSTYYFQRVARENLKDVMQIEATRMSGLVLNEGEVKTERLVVREERRSNVEGDPVKLLTEQLYATLYQNHSYSRPPIGWPDEIVTLTPEQADAFYRRYYSPQNAFVIVAGDVTPAELRELAETTYGKVPKSDAVAERVRTTIPQPLAARRIVFNDPRTPRATLFRYYLTPSYSTADAKEAASLEVLATILGEGEASRMHQELVSERKAALAVGARYFGNGRDAGHLALFGLVAKPEQRQAFEEALDAVLAEIAKTGVTEEELSRAKSQIEAKLVFERDNQMKTAVRYGEGLSAGLTVEAISKRPELLQSVTLDDVKVAAERYLQARRSVTGLLLPAARGE